MSIGSRIYQARVERNLSQRALAGETITRNMLSLLEHDQANPSLETLRYLADRLGKPVSYFLEEPGGEPAGGGGLSEARQALRDGEFGRCLELLEQPPQLPGAERELIWAEAVLGAAEQAAGEGRPGDARAMLEQGEARFRRCPYAQAYYQARRNLLLARTAEDPHGLKAAADHLPDVDELLIQRARAALHDGKPARAAALLDAAEDRQSVRWNILRGDAAFDQQDWSQALRYYHKAEPEAPRQVRRGLQLCYEKLRNFEKAYYYATMEQQGGDNHAF